MAFATRACRNGLYKRARVHKQVFGAQWVVSWTPVEPGQLAMSRDEIVYLAWH